MLFDGTNAGAILRNLRGGYMREVALVAKNALSLHTDAELNKMFSDALSRIKRTTGGKRKSKRNIRGGGIKLSSFFAIFFLLMIQTLTTAESARRDCSTVPDGWFIRSVQMQACLDYNENLDKSTLETAKAEAREADARAKEAEARAQEAQGKANEARANEAAATARLNAENAQIELDRQISIELARSAKAAAAAKAAADSAKSAAEAAKARKEAAESDKEYEAVVSAAKIAALKDAASYEQTKAAMNAAMRYARSADAADASRYGSNTLSTICATLLACVVSVAGTSYVFTVKMRQMQAAIMGGPPLAIAAAPLPPRPPMAAAPPLPPGPPPAVIAATPPMPSPAALAANRIYLQLNHGTANAAPNGYYGRPQYMDPGDPENTPLPCGSTDEARRRSWRGYRIYAQTPAGAMQQIHTYNDLAAAPPGSLHYGWTNNPAIAGGTRRRNRRQRRTRR